MYISNERTNFNKTVLGLITDGYNLYQNICLEPAYLAEMCMSRQRRGNDDQLCMFGDCHDISEELSVK